MPSQLPYSDQFYPRYHSLSSSDLPLRFQVLPPSPRFEIPTVVRSSQHLTPRLPNYPKLIPRPYSRFLAATFTNAGGESPSLKAPPISLPNLGQD